MKVYKFTLVCNENRHFDPIYVVDENLSSAMHECNKILREKYFYDAPEIEGVAVGDVTFKD